MGVSKRLRELDGPDAADDLHTAPAKKARTFSEQDKRLAKVYEHLANEVGDVRIQAAKQLLNELSPKEAEHAVDVKTVLTRLIKGLCSSRKAARLGFFVALTEVLRQVYLDASTRGSRLSLADLLSLIVKSTEADGSASGQEKRDHLLGRVAACNAVLISHILDQPSLATVELTDVLELLSSLARSKAWLREECGNVLFSYVQGLNGPGTDDVGKLVLAKLGEHELLKTPEGIAIWVALRPKIDAAVLPKNVWKGDDPLQSRNWHAVAVILRTGSTDGHDGELADGRRQKGGASQPNPSFAWNAVLTAYIAFNEVGHDTPDLSAVKAFDSFWRELVDNNLFTQSASQEKKGWGFAILASAITALPAWTFSALFSPNLTKSLVNQRVDASRYLHSAAQVPLNAIKRRAAQDSVTAAALLTAIFGIPEVANFDQTTKSKTVEALVSAPYSENVLANIAHTICDLLSHALPESITEQGVRKVKGRITTLFDLLVTLIRQHDNYVHQNRIGAVQKWAEAILFELADIGYVRKSTDVDLETRALSDVARLARTRLQACLSVILNSSSNAGYMCAQLVVTRLYALLVAEKRPNRKANFDKSIRKRLRTSYDELTRPIAAGSLMSAIRLLHSLTLLEVFAGEADALAMLDDIDPLYASLDKASSSTSTDSSVIVTEIILTFVAKPSTLYRKLGETVFTAIAPQLTAEALQALVEVLQKPESMAGQEELFDKADEVEDGDEIDSDDASVDVADASQESSDEDDESLDSDVELVDGDEDGENATETLNATRVSGRSTEVEGMNHDSDEESEADAEEEELLKLDAVLAEALGTSNRDDDNAESDASMDSEQMMALEPTLTKAFQDMRKAESGNKKQDRRDAKENMVTFKNKVLDLLQIYVKKEHANPLAISLILPLLSLMRTTTTKQLGEKAFNVLKAYFDAGKGKNMPMVGSAEETLTIIASIHEAAERNEAKIYGTACSRASLFLARVLLAQDASHFDLIEDLYSNTMKQRRKKGKKSRIQRSFFLDWTNYAFDLVK